MAGQGGLTEALVLQIGFALLSRVCQTWNQCSYTFTLQGKLGDAQCPEAPQQWRELQPGEETPENGTVAGKRGSNLLKSSSITAFVHGTSLKAVGGGWSLSAAGPAAQQTVTLLPDANPLKPFSLSSLLCSAWPCT